MSAFMVDEGQVDYLISAARALHGPYLSLPFDPWVEEKYLGQTLLAQNARSVLARYGDSVDAEEARNYSEMIEGYGFQKMRVALEGISEAERVVTIAQIIKACDCMEYQSCETSDWERTDAALIVGRIRSAAIHRLPGMTDARWSITREGVS